MLLAHETGQDFQNAAQAALKFLHERLGFDLWMLTRVDGDDWIVLQAEDHGYGVKANQVFRWADSFCSRMVRGEGPRIAVRSSEVPAYAAAPIGRVVPIEAYIGLPLRRGDGSVFGTLCAIDPEAQPDSIEAEAPLLELLASLLSTLLVQEAKAIDAMRRAEQAAAESMLDPLTQLFNRRSWQRLTEAEEARTIRHGTPLCLGTLDLDGFKEVNDTLGHAEGDAILCRAADVIRAQLRSEDVAARLGGDEFALLLPETSEDEATKVMRRLQDALRVAGITASVGSAAWSIQLRIDGALEAADEAMYADKAGRAAPHRLAS